jgi:glutamine synthetase
MLAPDRSLKAVYVENLDAVMEKMKKMGFDHYYVGPELEYFYFKDSKGTEILDEGGYFDLTPPDIASSLRLESIMVLEQMGIKVQSSHHEVAISQHEIDLNYTDALTMADNIMTARLIIKEIAQKHEVYATFMPKPVYGINGSGSGCRLEFSVKLVVAKE